MASVKAADTNAILRKLPSVDALLRSDVGTEITLAAGESHAALLAREVIETLRGDMGKGSGKTKAEVLETATQMISERWQDERLLGTQRVINATGVIIHTNLGRAPLSENAQRAIVEATGYCTLEYDLNTGKRGRRGERAEQLLSELTGAEDVLIVNNCAAAAFFVLTVFAAGGETIVSRGELVEIGGDFRVPDILEQSGSVLCEIGTTNRTKLADYERAISERTKLILRVHPSNYRIVGFTATPPLDKLAELAHKRGLMLYEDIGSGALTELADEPPVARSIAAGVDIVTYSGDKLLGGPQAGIIAGRKDAIDRLRKHPLYRALRVDKLTYAGLEATLVSYRRGDASREIPVQQMLAATKDEIALGAERFVEVLGKKLGKNAALKLELIDGISPVGGGAAPAVELPTTLIALSHRSKPAARLEQLLRISTPPIIARISDDRVVLDLRTVSESDMIDLTNVLLVAF